MNQQPAQTDAEDVSMATDTERVLEFAAKVVIDEQTIADLTAQGVSDSASITELKRQGAADQASIGVLEAQAVVDREIITALAEQGVLDRDKIGNLEAALTSARRIGAAMGIVMATEKFTEEQAFDALKVQSQHSHRKLREVAEDVLFTGVVGTEQATDPDTV